ncbi:MAG: phage portal protein, partial [Christensenella sp.]
MELFGRTKIYTDVSEITRANVVDVINAALPVFKTNSEQINKLYDYYKGKQNILNRDKPIRPEITNKVVVNRANEIVTFKVSYLLGEPLQYVARSKDNKISDEINMLNEIMYSEDKASKDKEIADWLHICGVAYRLVLPDKNGEEENSPISIFTLNPMETFVIYYSGVGNKAIAGVNRIKMASGEVVYSVYSKNRYFEIKGGKVISEKPTALSSVPIIEYIHNEARMGAFEPVITLLDAINTVESSRIDAIEQFVQSILIFENCAIDKEKYDQLRKDGALLVKSDNQTPAKVYRVGDELAQGGTQTVVDDLYNAILTICGMPSQGNGNSSDSSNNGAVIMRNGWQSAEARAKDTETLFKRSEQEFLKLVLNICNATKHINLTLGQIEQKFTRQNYSDILSKSQVLTTMLANPKIHPQLAFTICG